jgi:hypothetical protein
MPQGARWEHRHDDAYWLFGPTKGGQTMQRIQSITVIVAEKEQG